MISDHSNGRSSLRMATADAVAVVLVVEMALQVRKMVTAVTFRNSVLLNVMVTTHVVMMIDLCTLIIIATAAVILP